MIFYIFICTLYQFVCKTVNVYLVMIRTKVTWSELLVGHDSSTTVFILISIQCCGIRKSSYSIRISKSMIYMFIFPPKQCFQ